ncbi:hypothetical protein QG37_03552 [Candidozyma auris]|nr:hypothetical protein QG37_03552 [[Candida] auris]
MRWVGGALRQRVGAQSTASAMGTGGIALGGLRMGSGGIEK